MTRVLLILGALLLLPAAPAGAAIFNVTNTNDSGSGSLRQAIITSNGNLQGDTINVPAGTYNTGSELAIAGEALTIDGAGAGSTIIRATGAFRVFRIANTSDLVEFFDLTITNGNVTGNGGGILSQVGSGPLTIEDSSVEHNRATATATDGGGGGIYNDGGLLTVQRSTVRDNTTSATSGANNGGGGIHETGAAGLTLEDSTVSGNAATVSGSNSGGGGIWSSPAATLRNSTLSGNSLSSGLAAPGGGGAYFTPSGGGTVTHVTIAGNSAGLPGGGIANGGVTIPLRNTILAFNSASSPGSANCSGTFTSLGNNLENASTCGLGADPEDKPNTDPKLDPLADNGGPTQTRALRQDSPAIDAADAGHCGVVPQDQRGADRTSDGCDIGAYEFDGRASAAIPDCSPSGEIPITMAAAPSEGVLGINYKVDGGPEQVIDTPGGSEQTRTVKFSEGRRTLEYWGTFTNGVLKGHKQRTVLVDQTNPNVNVESAQGRSIYVIRRRASVNVQAADALSGLVGNPSGGGQAISTLRRGRQTVARTATDLCGNQAADSFAYQVLGPGLGVRAVIEELSGSVRVRSSGSARSAGVAQKGRPFSALRQPREIPIGTFIDTSRGRARITSSTTSGTRIQDGQFSTGLFQVLQSRRRSARGLTELRLKGSSFSRCRSSGRGKGSARSAASRTLRRLRSNARGRFRTRGRHSAATVRGTSWVTADRCDGTLTKVTRGRVAVRDFRRKKTVLLRAGKSYLAKARR